MATLDTLRAIAPEFAGEADETLNTFIGFAASRMSANEWGTLFSQGAAYLAAHLLTLSRRGAGAGAGAVTRRKAGEVEVSYGAVVGVLDRDATYATTPYGIEWLNLSRTLPPAARVY